MKTRNPSNGLSLGRIFGVEIVLQWGLLGLIALVAAGLAVGLLPNWHPQWSTAMRITVSLAAALALLVSVLLHELAHTLVARARGIHASRITLFLFGGTSHIDDPPDSPLTELLVAIVGPVTSFLLAGAAMLAAAVLHPQLIVQSVSDPQAAVASAGPLATILMWLAPVNFMLALFNLLPGYPLDGGRVFRAAAWAVVGDRLRATRYAAAGGRTLGWLLIAAGVASMLGVALPFLQPGWSGLWLVFIGWFIAGAARSSYHQEVIRAALRGVHVNELMRREPHVLRADQTLQSVIDEDFPRLTGQSFPVAGHGGELVGILRLRDLQSVSRELRDNVQVGMVMVPRSEIETVSPSEAALEGLKKIAKTSDDNLVVVDEEDHVRGVLGQTDVIHYAALRAA